MFTVDAHIDLPWIHTKHGPVDFRMRQTPYSERAVDLPRMLEGGLDSFFAALYLPDSYQDRMTYKEVLEAILQQLNRLNTMPFSIVTTKKMAEEALDHLHVPIFLGLEGGRLIGKNTDNLQTWAKFGVKYLTLTHNRNTSWANSATDTPSNDHNGLTNFGVNVVTECRRLNMWIDVSHVHHSTIEEVLEEDHGVVVATHSAVAELVNHPRNLSAEYFHSLDMIGVPFAKKFIGNYKVAEHIDYIAQNLGTHEKVGIGSDLDGAAMVKECPNVSKWSFWMEDLSKMGYGDRQILDIAGGNWLNLLRT